MKNVFVLLSVVLGGCATYVAETPTNIPDGNHTHEYLTEYNTTVYQGEWKDSKPHGQGAASDTIHIDGKTTTVASCDGTFGIEPPPGKYSALQGSIWAKGNVYTAGRKEPSWQGYFLNSFEYQHICQVIGPGTQYTHNWKVTGTFKKIYELKNGPCQIESKQGERYEGQCSLVADKAGNTTSFATHAFGSPFSFGKGEGIYTDIHGVTFKGKFLRGVIKHGLMTVTAPQKTPLLALYENGQLVAENPSPENLLTFHDREAQREYEKQQQIAAEKEQRRQELARQQQEEQQRQEEAARRQQEEKANGFQWGKLAALGVGAAIGGVNKLSGEAQGKILAGMVQDSAAGQTGMSNMSNAVSSMTPTPVGSNTKSASTTSASDAAKACTTDYHGPNNDPQVDSYCKMAAFDACLHRATQQTTYDSEGRTACETLKGLLSATGTKNYSCSYCPYAY